MQIAKKMAGENFSIGALYNITKNQDNLIKTVGREKQFFRVSQPPGGRTAPIF